MNLVFHDNLNEFVIIQINDIPIYFKSKIEHAQHLEHYVLQKLKDNKFYVNHAKSEFVIPFVSPLNLYEKTHMYVLFM
jgi:hypothetical protein